MKNENKGKEGKEGRKLMGIKSSAIGKGKCSKSRKEREQESNRDCHRTEVQKKMKHEHTEKGRKKTRSTNSAEIGTYLECSQQHYKTALPEKRDLVIY
jgi:hypothetical protein